ncbi:hypothetical protein [Actinoplanes sp. TFC3]|uniref:hypothetical protein n=1 Tax=Actinoplanes sp. TFC3 TaxID=1710355 RepID=UPI00083562D4|nr:hypothetical protein [Actinoplanes sp. TFC3]
MPAGLAQARFLIGRRGDRFRAAEAFEDVQQLRLAGFGVVGTFVGYVGFEVADQFAALEHREVAQVVLQLVQVFGD